MAEILDFSRAAASSPPRPAVIIAYGVAGPRDDDFFHEPITDRGDSRIIAGIRDIAMTMIEAGEQRHVIEAVMQPIASAAIGWACDIRISEVIAWPTSEADPQPVITLVEWVEPDPE
jgi:hypothetical protein